MAVMLNGHIHQVGEPREVFAHPVDAQVAEFLGTQN